MRDVKQAIVIRKDLKMRRGKEIAQGAHASISWLTKRLRLGVWKDVQTGAVSACNESPYAVNLTDAELLWIAGSFKKVCLQVSSEEELMDVYHDALYAGLNVDLITDSGLTEFGGVPTRTCLAVGPAEAERVDAITGKLKLY